jgi:hypothetical protein
MRGARATARVGTIPMQTPNLPQNPGIEVVKQAHFGRHTRAAERRKIEDVRKILIKAIADFRREWQYELEYLKKYLSYC